MVLFGIEIADYETWLRTSGIEIVLIAIGSVLVARFIHGVASLAERRVAKATAYQVVSDLVKSEPTKYIHTAIQAIDWTLRSVTYFTATVLILIRFGVPLTSLVAPATVLGVAVGFGAQTLVQDVLGGFFIITERQYGVGDVIRISGVGLTTGVSGTVEEVTLRITKIRSLAGELIAVRNGQILQVANLSRDWSQVVIDIQLPAEKKASQRAREILDEVCKELANDERLIPVLLTPPAVTGIESISLGYVVMRVVARTLPSKQFEAGRIMRARIIEVLSEEDLLPDSSSSAVIQQMV
ncbi:small conductance mechanosensitive channel [Ferrithrix thermotolerans DSM 19514]|uniref:Small conductance mechanosensitive channel n=1 Tax=Ferrithrix thermotolerans DSM 19514 TaxID=1121881 RepID=A0A1M4XL26_9ACTN|nr:mechanosensitive ion channel family protein [Ferrithrix thermotolerans]SHE94284.1 small conductance mechanosensitive channel [Ferrithrix thermotolerans DSM 19514]